MTQRLSYLASFATTLVALFWAPSPAYSQGTSVVPRPYTIRTLALPDSHTLVNSNGQVAVYYSGQPTPGAFFWDSATGNLSSLEAAGLMSPRPTCINEAGQVVGVSVDMTDQPQVFLWQSGAAEALSLRAPAFATGYYHINDAGLIAGTFDDRRKSRVFIWEDHHVSELGIEGTDIPFITGLTVSGKIIGGYYDLSSYHPFVWQGGSVEMIDIPDAVSFPVVRMNEEGQVAGSYTTMLETNNRGFFWQAGSLTELDLGGVATDIATINVDGHVAGTVHELGTGSQAFVWAGGYTTLLETAAGEESSAVWINDRSVVVGQKGPLGQNMPVPCLWQDGHSVSLKETLPAYLHWDFASVKQVANSGDILAVASRNGTTYLAVLHPLVDSDGDGLPDEWETYYGLNPQFADDAEFDSDADGLTNRQEYQAGTSPINSDTDGDGMNDGWEVAHGIDPRDTDDGHADTDADGLNNLLEYQIGTDPKDADSDQDGLTDGQEVQLGTSPLNPDSDLDGMTDGWENMYGLNLFVNDGMLDPDNDGFSNLQEYRLGTDPLVADADTDGDGQPNPVDPWPTDYYNTSLPTLTVTSGANQAGVTGALLLNPIVVRVTNTYGQVLANAPLLVTSSPAGATFALTPAAGHFSPTLSPRTGVDGTIAVYVRTPGTPMAFTVNFTATSGQTFRVATAAAQSANAPSIAAGEYHTVALGSSGMVWAWGLNSSGQLGDGTYLQRSLPSPVSGLSGVKSVVAGGYFSVALKEDGTVWAWGANRLGQLGDGTFVNSAIPVRVGTLTNIVAIAAGTNHSLALCGDGTVYSWGFNSDGQLGDGTTSARNQPVVVSGTGPGSGILAVTAGAYHSLALLTGGGVKGWGANFFGALGDNVGTHVLSPAVLSLTNITSLTAGAYHTMAVTSMGDAEALGWNENGQLGDSTTTSRFTPASIIGLSNLKSLAASKSIAGHCVALSEGGSVSAWGSNDYGQVGDPTITGDQLEPESISVPAEITQIVAGGSHTIALGADGTIYMWGGNEFGQLGDGTNIARVQPVRKAGLSLLPTALDTDQDALPDSWEMEQFGNLSQNSDSDLDQDGLKTLLEYETARNPNAKDFEPSSAIPLTSQLIQMSTRGAVGVGDDVIIAGFIVTGDAPKTVIFRAMGPSIGIPGTLEDPKIEIRDSYGLVAENDNWQDDPFQADIIANKYGLAPRYSHEAALIVTVPPGNYTALISGVDHTTGIALFEIYDVDQSDSTLANLSARARLDSGSNVVIAGFFAAGAQDLRVLARGIGPSLHDFGINDYLPNPYLHLHDIDGVQIADNDNWRQSPNWQEMQNLGLQPSNDLEAALIRDLPTGPNQVAGYTAVVEASPNTPVSGIALVEVYNVDTGLDTDGDGLTDWEETNVYHTNPNLWDTDGDGMDDGWEVHHGLDPHNNDAGGNLDGDEFTNLYEYQHQMDPAHFDLRSGTTVGATQGKLSVDNSGGTTYSIPIVVSPGTAGMQPKLSFEYNSRAGNGLLGVGWSIGGLSAITRCSSTIDQDGQIGGVNFTANDRFSLDGQRLMVIAGEEGGAGEYRTEMDSFSKIVSTADSGPFSPGPGPTVAGPARFTVQTKSGLTYTYGEDENSRIRAFGTTGPVISWALSKISDTSKNSIVFRYERSVAGDEFWPTEINYTVNEDAGLNPYASVKFEYVEEPYRPDILVSYVAGSKITQSKRLARVKTLFGADLVRQYDLSYVISPQTGRSRIDRIQEGAGPMLDGGPRATFDPTTFAWSTEGETDSFAYSPFHPTTPGNKRTQQWVPGDLNGDGRSDIVKVTGNQNGGQNGQAIFAVSVAQPSAPGGTTDFVTTNWNISGTAPLFNYNTDTWQSGDYNGDGKADLIRVYRDTEADTDAPVKVAFYRNGNPNLANTFLATSCTITGAPSIPKDHLVYPADVDGDGKLDLVLLYGHSGVYISVLKNMGFDGTTQRFQHETWYQNTQNTILFGLRLQSFLGDVNGDGLPDIVFVKNTGTGNNLCEAWVFLNQLGSTQPGLLRSFRAEKWLNPAVTGEPNVEHAIWFSGDFNGDGLLDLGRLRKGTAEVAVYPSTGRGFPKESWGNLTVNGSSLIIPDDTNGNDAAGKAEVRGGDFNGDGRSDIGLVTSTQFGTNCWKTTQYSFYSLGSQTWKFTPGRVTQIADCFSSLNAITTFDWLPADFNGDGKEDFARTFGYVSNGQTGIGVNIWTGTGGVHDLLQSATDGLGSQSSVKYTPLTDPTVYAKTTVPPAPEIADAIDLMVPMSVVSQVHYDDGLDGEYTIDYVYNDLRANARRGLLGFRFVTSTDQRTHIVSKAKLSQVFPFTGMTEQVDSLQGPSGNNLIISSVINTYADHSTQSGRVHHPFARESIATSYDVDSNHSLISTITTVVDPAVGIDNYGNTLKVVVSSNDGFRTTTESNYTIDEGTWRIGTLRDSTVTSEAPGQPNVVRKSGFGYAGNGQIASETIEPDNTLLKARTDYEHDAFGNTRITTTPGDTHLRATTTYYDPRGRLVTSVINALGQGEIREYDERWGSVTKVTGPNGLSTRTIYDDFGRKRLEIRPDGSRSIITYDKIAEGDPYKPQRSAYRVATFPDGASFSAVYFDRLGRELRKVTKSGVDDNNESKVIAVDTHYNELGQPVEVTRPYFFAVTPTPLTINTHYDLLGRVIQVDTPKEGGGYAITTNHYVGLTVESQNPLQQNTVLKTITLKDTQGHVRQVTDAKGGTILYTYDAVGNLIRSEDAFHNLTLMIYDVRGRKKLMDDPDLGVWNYDYNRAGELTYQRDANGNITTTEYDLLGRMTKRTDMKGTPAGTVLEGVSEWTYDEGGGAGVGKLHRATYTPNDSSLQPVVRTMSYDDKGRIQQMIERIDNVDYQTSTTYDSLSRVSTITYPTGFAVRHSYDANGYPQKVERSDASGPVYWKANRYDADGHITRHTAGNGVVTDRVYVPATGMLQEIHSGTNSAVQNLSYQFDLIGNLTNRTDHLQTVQGGGQTQSPGNPLLKEDFVYDELNRLRFATVAGQSAKEVRYDAIGNITFKSGLGNYTYTPGFVPTSPGPEASHPHAVRNFDNNNDPEAEYDRNGNMLSGFGRTTTWTAFNMPKQIGRDSNGASSFFAYDSEHSRIKQVAHTNNSMTTTIYVASGLYEVVDDADKVSYKHYINSPAGRIALYTKEVPHTIPFSPGPGPTVYKTHYLHKDHLDSIDAITSDAAGAPVIERDSFDAWGARRLTDWQPPGTTPITSILHRGFTGHEQLDDLGLVHMNGRIYDAGIGRFLSADPFIQAPLEMQNYNRYSYVLNNPTSMTDPSGFNFLGNFGKWLTKTFGPLGGQIVIGVIAIVAGIATAGLASAAVGAMLGSGYALTAFGSAVVAGAGFGFGSAFASTILSGASLGQALQAAVIGAVIGGISGGIAKGLGDLNRAGQFFSWGHGGQTLGHALLGGAVSEIQGGDFESGALVGAINGGFGPAIDKIGGGAMDFEHVAERVAVAAVLGGTAAELGGGKFANGAVTAAFLRLYNEELHLKELAKKDPRAIVDRVIAELDKQAPKVKDVEIAGTIDDKGNVRWGEPGTRTGSTPPTITDDTVAVFHFHLTGPDLVSYKFSCCGPGKDEFFISQHTGLIHVVGVLDAQAGSFSVFYQTPEEAYFHIGRATPQLFKYLK
jgi:RHS repeat-associated protein